LKISIKVETSLENNDNDHKVRIYLSNDNAEETLLWEETWDGYGEREFEFSIPADVALINGLNRLRIENASGNNLSFFHLDWYEISYFDTYRSDDTKILSFKDGLDSGNPNRRLYLLRGFTEKPTLYDVTDYPEEVSTLAVDGVSINTLVSGWQFLDEPGRDYWAAGPPGKISPQLQPDEATTLRSTSGADHIIITHEKFYNAIQELATYRRNQGLEVLVVKITDVYDEFSGGISDPGAIKEFLKYAYFNWSIRPRFVLLVGDTTYDFKDNLGYGASNEIWNYVPTYFYDFEEVLGEVPSDNWFADVVEEYADGDTQPLGIPEIAIGRIPAKFAEDVAKFVEKTIAYEFGSNHGENALFVAGMSYEDASQDLVNQFFPEDPNLVQVDIVHRKQYVDDIVAARTDLLDRLNSDPWLVNYIGHGAVTEWGNSVEQWFKVKSSPDVSGLIVPGIDNIISDLHYFVLVSLSCLNSNFAIPNEGVVDIAGFSQPASLAESFLLAYDRGAIAVWADSAYGQPSQYNILAEKFYDFLLRNEQTIGEAAKNALSEAWYNPGTDVSGITRDLIYTVIFLGDPATRLMRPDFPVPPSP
jgi:hypothetical protein